MPSLDPSSQRTLGLKTYCGRVSEWTRRSPEQPEQPLQSAPSSHPDFTAPDQAWTGQQRAAQGPAPAQPAVPGAAQPTEPGAAQPAGQQPPWQPGPQYAGSPHGAQPGTRPQADYQVQPQPLPTDPVAGTRPRPQLAVVTWTIIAVCFTVWLAELLLPGFFQQVALSPALGEREPWRFLTSAFAHSLGITHIAFNMLALYSVGQGLELSLGRARFAALYLVSALAGGVGFVLLATPPSALNPLGDDWYTGMVGASGAVFGLFGAMVVLYRHAGISLQSLGVVLALNALISFTVPGIAWQGHLGGFLAGLLLGWLMLRSTKDVWRGKPDRTWWWVAAVTLTLVAMLVVKYLAI